MHKKHTQSEQRMTTGLLKSHALAIAIPLKDKQLIYHVGT